jgi:plasmid stabilization system protein ParE
VKRSVFFTPAAQAGVIEAQEWYEGEAAGLGARFRGEVDVVVQRLGANPFQFPTVLADVRRARLRKFPYGLFFRILDEDVFVIACFHSRRDPRQWQGRI